MRARLYKTDISHESNHAQYHVSKDTLEVLGDSLGFSVANAPEGLGKLPEHVAESRNPLVAFEATGGYERLLFETLASKGIPFARLNPARVRAFAKSEGVKAKTDPIDARMILRFAKRKAVRPAVLAEPARRELADFLDRRNHLTEQLAREKNRLKNSAACIHESISRMLEVLKGEISVIESRVRDLLDGNAKLREQVQIAQSAVGAGEVTAWTILSNLSEIETLGRNQIVALAGIAPFNNDSGKAKKKGASRKAGPKPENASTWQPRPRPYTIRSSKPMSMDCESEASPTNAQS